MMYVYEPEECGLVFPHYFVVEKKKGGRRTEDDEDEDDEKFFLFVNDIDWLIIVFFLEEVEFEETKTIIVWRQKFVCSFGCRMKYDYNFSYRNESFSLSLEKR